VKLNAHVTTNLPFMSHLVREAFAPSNRLGFYQAGASF
jgi:hypothetical protein